MITIRSNRGVPDCGLIEIANAHDHFSTLGLLPQEMYIDNITSNIVDDQDIMRFLMVLKKAPNCAAATFWFKEHVVSIVKHGDWYYWIDSMAGPGGMAT